jgi:hypothetical protein
MRIRKDDWRSGRRDWAKRNYYSTIPDIAVFSASIVVVCVMIYLLAMPTGATA